MDEPNLIEKAKNLAGAMKNWAVDDKFQKVTPEQYWHRKQICLSCPYWDPEGYAGIGMCKKCGCSAAKLYIPSAFCPDMRWISISYTENNNSK